MLRFGSLRTRLIVFSTVPLIAILVLTLWTTIRTGSNTVRESVQQSLTEASAVYVQLLATQRDEMVSAARVISRDPRFFATFSIPMDERGAEFVPTLEQVSVDFLRITEADFLCIFFPDGRHIVSVDRNGALSGTLAIAVAGRSGIEQAAAGAVVRDYFSADGRLVSAALAPVFVAQRLEAVVRLGRFIDEGFATEFMRMTGANVCFALDGTAVASTFPGTGDLWPTPERGVLSIAGESVQFSEAFNLVRDSNDFLAIHVRVEGAGESDGFDTFIGRELKSALTPIIQMERQVAAGGILAVLVTLFIAYFVASSITRPLSSIVDASTALQKGRYDHPVEPAGSDEVAELGRNFVAMRESMQDHVAHLKNLDQAKSNFIALAGHELRTPLTVISGFNEMIASGAIGDVPENVKETASVIKTQLSDLNRLVQSMLDLTYFEQGLHTLAREPIDLNALVTIALENRAEALAGRDLTVETRLSGEDVRVTADWTRISDAVLHIVDNAIRFTPDGGRITASTYIDGDKAHIVVEDTGVGIAPGELKWIFEKVYEVGDILNHSSGRHGFGSKGFGLGLALCKAIATAHGGRVLAESTPGRGSRFSIVLPTTPRALAQQAPTPEGVLV